MGQRLPSDLNPQLQSLFSPISVHSDPVDLTTLPPAAAPTLGETGTLIQSSLHNVECNTSPSDAMTLDSSFSSLSDDYSSGEDDQGMDEVVMPCQRWSHLVNKLWPEIVALRKQQLPGWWVSATLLLLFNYHYLLLSIWQKIWVFFGFV